ncbi:MAG: ATP-binding protein [Enterococcus sp.]|nr:ATP-binding protein [Enterococcus sp.]
MKGEDNENVFTEYLYYGGLPLTVLLPKPNEKANYLNTLFSKTYETDIIERYKVKNPELIEKILDFIASTIGSFVNPTNIANEINRNFKLNVSRNTVEKYINYLQNSFLVSKAKRFDIRGREYITGQQKYYFADIGLRNSRLNFRQFDMSRLLENAVYHELVYRDHHVDVGRVQVLEKNRNGNFQTKFLESDFAINDMSARKYIQVAQGVDNPDKEAQELRSLKNIRDDFPKILLVNQCVPRHYTEDGILIMSIRDFLLEQ